MCSLGAPPSSRRWNHDGYIQEVDVLEFGLDQELVRLLSDDNRRGQAIVQPGVVEKQLREGTSTWSLSSNLSLTLSSSLSHETMERWRASALRLICFACPPICQDSSPWYVPSIRQFRTALTKSHRLTGSKSALWALLDKLTPQGMIPLPLRNHVLEALLVVAEKGPLNARRIEAERAGMLLCKSAPAHLHASVALFQSIVCRLDGDFTGSDNKIKTYLKLNLQPVSRRDHALAGRLHLSTVENMIQRHCHNN
jgi:hypothetical protein